MSRKWMICAVAVLCAASFLVGNVVAQEQGGGGAGGMQAPAWMQTTKEHEDFKKTVGEWNAKCQFWIAPGQPPMQMDAESSYEVILGGKFLTQNFKAAVMGQPMTGHLLMGFDTINKEYVSIWVDNFSPYVNILRGTEKDGQIVLTGKEVDQMTGKLRDTRHVLTWQGDDTHVYTMFSTGADGKEFKSGEITYARAK